MSAEYENKPIEDNPKEQFRKAWGFYPEERIQCWYPGCRADAVDMAHIDQKGMGGRDSAEYIENWCALCRMHHRLTEGIAAMKDLLYRVVVKRIFKYKPNHVWSEKFKLTAFWRNNEQDIINKTLK